MRELLGEIRFDAATAESYPIRTLWRTVLDLQERSMSTHFFLGDDETGLRDGEELVFTAAG